MGTSNGEPKYLEEIFTGTVDFFLSGGGKKKGGWGFITPHNTGLCDFIFQQREREGNGVFFWGSACQNKKEFPPEPGKRPNTSNKVRSILPETQVRFRLVKTGNKNPKKKLLAVQVSFLASQQTGSC